MGFLDWLFSRSPGGGPGAALIGRWRLAEADGELDLGERMRMELRRDGLLLYVTAEGDRDRIARLTYRVEGETLIIDRPPSPVLGRTKFTLLGADTLVLDCGGSRAWFERVRRPA
ncbi:MAG TPA: hypothetical protein VFS44_08860 [Gemmatimonadaceae bacterium]|nr:hypothetical protein [Gemmatimonadaceae bacterium]